VRLSEIFFTADFLEQRWSEVWRSNRRN